MKNKFALKLDSLVQKNCENLTTFVSNIKTIPILSGPLVIITSYLELNFFMSVLVLIGVSIRIGIYHKKLQRSLYHRKNLQTFFGKILKTLELLQLVSEGSLDMINHFN